MTWTDERFDPWTPEREEQLRSMWPGQLTCGEIADKLGKTTIRAVMSKGARLKLPRREVKFNKKRGDWKWTPEQNETIRSLWGKLSCQEIADVLGNDITKAAVIGKAHRMKLERQRYVTTVKKGQRKPKRKPWKPAQSADMPTPDALRDLPADQSPDAISLFDIRPNQCRWPLNNAVPISEFLFCGAVKDWGHSYCDRHNHIAYRNVAAPSEQRQAQQRYRWLKRYPLPSAAVVGWDAA